MRFFTPIETERDFPKRKLKYAWLPVEVWDSYKYGTGQMGTIWLEFYYLEQTSPKSKWWPKLKN